MRKKLWVKVLLCAVMCMLMGNYWQITTYAAESEEVEIVDVTIRMSDYVKDVSGVAPCLVSDATITKETAVYLNSYESGLLMTGILFNYTFTYSDGVYVTLNAVNSASITNYNGYQSQWTSSGSVLNYGNEGRYVRDCTVYNSVTGGRTVYRITLICDLYGDTDTGVVIVG